VSLISSGRSSFSVTLSAVHWPSSIWFEWNFTFVSAVGAGCLVCLFPIGHLLFQLLFISRQNYFCPSPLFDNIVLNLCILRTSFNISNHDARAKLKKQKKSGSDESSWSFASPWVISHTHRASTGRLAS